MFLYFWIFIVSSLNGGNCKRYRVVGGKNLSIKCAPYQALLNFDDSLCGGSIISKKLILTAAHCIMDADPKEFKVKVGLTNASKRGTTMAVKKIYTHPDFNKELLENDVAIVELKGKLKYGKRIAPVELNFQKNKKLTGRRFRISGWGTLGDASSTSETLQAVNVHFVSKMKCRKAYRKENIHLSKSMMCAASRGKDACQGDSGGPLVSRGIQYGILSGGLECAHPDYPGIYTNIATVKDFIKRIMKT